MSFKLDHPEQDPAEGSRKVIDRELARQRQQAHSPDEHDRQADGNDPVRKSVQQEHRPM